MLENLHYIIIAENNDLLLKYVARKIVFFELQTRTSYFSWLRPDLVLSLASSFGVKQVVFFCSGISMVLFENPGIFKCLHRSYP